MHKSTIGRIGWVDYFIEKVKKVDVAEVGSTTSAEFIHFQVPTIVMVTDLENVADEAVSTTSTAQYVRVQ